MAFSSASGSEPGAEAQARPKAVEMEERHTGAARLSRSVRWWVIGCVIVGLAFWMSQLAEIPVRSALRGYDNTFNYLWLRSAVEDGDWDFRNDLAECNTLVPAQRASALALQPTATGRIPNKYGIGWAVLTLPFYLLAEAIVAVGDVTGWWQLAGNGFGPVHQILVQIGHVGLAVVGLFLAWRVLTRWLGDREAALVGVLAVWSASSLLYYQTVNLSMSHGAAFFSIAAMAYAVERARAAPATGTSARSLWWLLAGAAFGLAIIVRFQLAVFGVVIVGAMGHAIRCRAEASSGSGPGREPVEAATVNPAAHAAGDTLNSAEPAVRCGVLLLAKIALGAAPFLLLQMWAWRVVYGKWLVFGYGAEGEGFHWSAPEVLDSLFSPWHGLFYWHPFLLVAAIGMLAWTASADGRARGWAAAWLVTAYINAAWWCWWFASAFGNRGHDAALLPLMAGAGWWFQRANPLVRRGFTTLALLAGAWNVYLALLYRAGAISRSAPVSWSEMLAAAARLPEALRM